ncbi:MAG: hypothetical protein ACOYLE_00570 [Bacteroidales bacterium]
MNEFETTELFLTDKIDLIDYEIYQNSISIGLTSEQAKNTSSHDILMFLSKVKLNRQKQLIQSDLKIDLIYYLWLDEMAGQLCFNFINSHHSKLPFGCELNFVDSERDIIDSFLKSSYLDGIPFEELKYSEQVNELIEPVYRLNIFMQTITRELKL